MTVMEYPITTAFTPAFTMVRKAESEGTKGRYPMNAQRGFESSVFRRLEMDAGHDGSFTGPSAVLFWKKLGSFASLRNGGIANSG